MTPNLNDDTTLVSLMPTDSRTATFTGSGIDMRDYTGQIVIIEDTEAATAGTAPTWNIKIQDSADDSTFADVTGATFAEVTATASQTKIGIVVDDVARYIRVVATLGGTSSPAFTSAVHLLGTKQVQ